MITEGDEQKPLKRGGISEKYSGIWTASFFQVVLPQFFSL